MAERGSVLPLVLGLGVVALVLVGVAVDLLRWGAVVREAGFAADAGASAGAAMLDEASLRAGAVALDPSLAGSEGRRVALLTRPRPERSSSATATADRVCVTVTQGFTPSLLRLVGLGGHIASASSCAYPARG